MSKERPQWARECAWEIMGNPTLYSEGEPGISLEEAQSRYDENEALLCRRNEIADIVMRHVSKAIDKL